MGDTYIPLLRDTKDMHYRYKMPKLTAKVEGSGNGIKTVITNMSAIAKALHRPPTYPTKYFGCELGAQVSMDTDRNEYIVNGAHDAEKLLTLLYSFIRKFVLCSKCNNPETDLKVIDKKINQSCAACGYRTTIPNTLHKLTTFIVSHPPDDDTKKSNGNSSGTKTRKDKKSKKGGNGTTTTGSNEDKKNEASANYYDDELKSNDKNDDGFESDDLTKDAYNERMRTLIEGVKGVHVGDQVERANIFYQLIIDKKNANQLNDTNVHKELLNEADRLGLREKAPLLLSEALFTDNIVEEVKQYRMLLLRFCYDNHKAQKYLLGGLEKLIGDVYKDKLINKTSLILKSFYDSDILEEEVLIEWSDKVSKKYVSKDIAKLLHEKAAPFTKWLKEAEVEDESEDETKHKQTNGQKLNTNSNNTNSKISAHINHHDDENDDDYDDDDDIDIEYSHRVTGIKVETVKPVAEQPTKNGDIDDDINIDDI